MPTARGTCYEPTGDSGASNFQARCPDVTAFTSINHHTSFGAIAYEPTWDGSGIAKTIPFGRDIYVWNGSAWVLPAP